MYQQAPDVIRSVTLRTLPTSVLKMENLDVKSADHFFYKAVIPRKNAKRIDNKDVMTSLDTWSSHPLDVMYGAHSVLYSVYSIR